MEGGSNWKEIWVLGFADRDLEGKREGFWEGLGGEEREGIWMEFWEKIREEKGNGRKRRSCRGKRAEEGFVSEEEE